MVHRRERMNRRIRMREMRVHGLGGEMGIGVEGFRSFMRVGRGGKFESDERYVTVLELGDRI